MTRERFVITTVRRDGTKGSAYAFHSAGSALYWLGIVLAKLMTSEIQSFTMAGDE